MGYPLTNEYYRWLRKPPQIVQLKPKFPKGKAEKKQEKRRTHEKGYYLNERFKNRYNAGMEETYNC